MYATKTINSFLKLDVSTAKVLLLLFGCDLFRRVASLMLETASSSIFLYEFLGKDLPIVFMLTALLMVLAAGHFLKIKKMPAVSAAWTLIGLSAITFLLYLLYVGRYNESASMGLMVWKNVCFLLSEITFLLVAMRFCKYDWQSWRFVGLLLTEGLAMIISGLAVTVLVFYITPQTIIAISSALLLAAGILLYMVSTHLDSHKAITTERGKVTGTSNCSKQFSLVSTFFLMLAFFIFSGYLIEYVFYKGVYVMYGAEWLSDMTAFFAIYHVFAGLMVLLIVFMFWHFKWLRGIKYTPLTLPFFIFIGAAGCLTVGIMTICASRMGKDIIYRLVMTPTAKFFSVPLLPHLSRKLSSIRRLLVEPTSILAAGLFLYGLEDAVPADEFATILLVCSILISLLSFASYRLYIAVTKGALVSHYWWGDKLFLEDAKLQSFIEKQVLNPDIEDTIYYLRVAENSYGVNVSGALIYSLNHSSEKVRIFALSRLEKLKISLALPTIRRLIEQDNSVLVRNKALEVYCVIGGEQTISYVETFLNNSNMQEGAIKGLLKTSEEGAFLAAGKIDSLIASGSKNNKILVCHILGAVRIKKYYRPLLKLMQDKDKVVQKEAIGAAAKLKNEVFAPEFINALFSPYLREYAAEGLLNLGEDAVPYLADLFNDDNVADIMPKVISLLGKIGGSDAYEILLHNIKLVNPALKLAILKVLTSKDYRFKYFGADVFVELIQIETQRKNWLLMAVADVKEAKGMKVNTTIERKGIRVLTEALNEEIKQSEQIISLAKRQLSYTLDVPTLSLATVATVNVKVGENYEAMPLCSRLSDIMTSPQDNLHDWTRAAAVYCAGMLKAKVLSEILKDILANDSCLLRETALFSLEQILPEKDIKELAKNYVKDNCKKLALLAYGIAE